MEFALNPAAVEEREDESVAAAEPANRTTAGPEPPLAGTYTFGANRARR